MPPRRSESDYWRDFLNGEFIAQVSQTFMHSLPHSPRCKLCQAPFAGWGGAVVGIFGYRPIAGNPRLCNWCFKSLANHPGGAVIDLTILVADLRGSTGIAERVGPTAFGALLNRFYAVASASIDSGRGIVDKYVGDGVIGLFFRGVSGAEHPLRAIEAGRWLLAAARDDREKLPVGAGILTGDAFVGVVGDEGGLLNFTAVGDAVNTASRLGSLAAEGELLVTGTAALASGMPLDGLERRQLEVRGRAELVEVVVLHA